MKDIILFSDYQVSQHLFNKVDFNRVKEDLDSKQKLILETSGGPATKKYVLNIQAPVLHSLRETLNKTVYMPNKMAKSTKTFYSPNKVPVIREHVIGAGMLDNNPAPDAIGRVQLAEYFDFNEEFRYYNLSSKNHKEIVKIVQEMMKEGVIYQDNFHGVGAIKASIKITDQDAIEKFLDERMMNFSVGGMSRDVYSPFNGKHLSELEEDDLGPYDSENGLSGFKLIGDVRFIELSTTLTPADLLAKVESMQLEEIRIQDKEKIEYNSKRTVIKETGFFDLKGEEKMKDTFELQDYCGPDNTFPVRSYKEALEALAALKESDLEDSVKDLVKKTIDIKKQKFIQEEKGILVDEKSFKEKVSLLTSFEKVNLLNIFKESVKDLFSKADLQTAFLAEKEIRALERLEVLEEEIKDQKVKQQAFEEENKNLKDKLNVSQKSFVTLAKAIRDNIECKNLEDLKDFENLEEEFESLLKDQKLFEKVEKIFEGFSPEKREKTQEGLENPVHQAREQEVEKTEYENFVVEKYTQKKVQDGASKANSWLKELMQRKMISDDFYNSLVKEA